MNVSVVIPVYNVEKYVEKCIISLLKQTVSDYEIILVDDGSTDCSGKICDEFSEKYDFVVTFHKKNGGLSDARNFGVQKAQGDYITFIDSDDYVREDYIEKLYNACLDHRADFSTALNLSVTENQIVKRNLKTPLSVKCFSGRELLPYVLVGEKGSMSAWAKMYKKEFLEKYPFPFGELYEDMEVIYQILNEVKIASFVEAELYYYLKREESIVRSKVTERHLYGIMSCIHMLETEIQRGGELSFYIKNRIVMQACGHLPNLVNANDRSMFLKIKNLVNPYIKEIITDKRTARKLKIRSYSYILPVGIGLLYARCLFSIKRLMRCLK